MTHIHSYLMLLLLQHLTASRPTLLWEHLNQERSRQDPPKHIQQKLKKEEKKKISKGAECRNFAPNRTRCLKITEKVSFNIASEASYNFILSGQKLVKSAKKAQFGEFLKT